MQASRSGPAALRGLATAYLAAALVFAAVISWLALFRHLSVPRHDDWFLLDDMYRTPLLTWIFSVQNGHRLPVTLLLLHLDQTLGNGRMHWLVVAAQASAWISALVLALALRDPGREPWLRRTLLGFGVFLLFWSGSAYNYSWGVNQGSVWTAMWLLIAVTALVQARGRTGTPAGRRRVWLAAGAAVLVTFGHGIGFAVWAALLAIWAVGRMPLRIGALLAAGALASLAVYSIGLAGSRGVPSGEGWVLALLAERFGDLALFACAFAGAPAGWILDGLALVAADGRLAASIAAGAALVTGAGVLPAAAWRSGAAVPAYALAGLGLMVFVLAGGLVVGFTRLVYGGLAQAVEIRFLCWSTLFWIGGAMALAGVAGPRARRLLGLALPALSLCALPILFEIRAAQAELEERDADVAIALLLGARPGALLLDASSRTPDVVDRVASQLERAGRSPFDDPRRGLGGLPFSQRFQAAQPACGRSASLQQRIPGGDLATVRGWLDPDAPASIYLVVVDSQGVIRGLGEERPTPRAGSSGRRWEGVVAGRLPDERYTAWAVLRDGRSACSAGGIGPGGGSFSGPTS